MSFSVWTTMNALLLKDLAAKTHRGLRGRVELGKAGGGISYGYRVTKKLDAHGDPIRGDREIDEAQAIVVRRIFEQFASGVGTSNDCKRAECRADSWTRWELVDRNDDSRARKARQRGHKQ
jgi:DNA invertase Pin-like site-specific DNA recombinase